VSGIHGAYLVGGIVLLVAAAVAAALLRPAPKAPASVPASAQQAVGAAAE
jgi:hypothetical protein